MRGCPVRLSSSRSLAGRMEAEKEKAPGVARRRGFKKVAMNQFPTRGFGEGQPGYPRSLWERILRRIFTCQISIGRRSRANFSATGGTSQALMNGPGKFFARSECRRSRSRNAALIKNNFAARLVARALPVQRMSPPLRWLWGVHVICVAVGS